jgi:hypothetical protein
MNDTIPPGTDVVTFFVSDSLLRCGTERGIYQLDPQDSIWLYENNNGLESKYIRDVCVLGNYTWVATSSGPFFNPGNSDWMPDYNGLFQREVSQVFRKGERIYALSADKIYYSDSIEAGFEVLNTQGMHSAYEIIITDSAWYAGSSTGFMISIDSGSSWTSYSNGLNGKPANNIAITSGYYFCTGSGLFRTRNDSIAWERVPDEIGTANVWGVNSLNDIVFATVYMSGLYRSENNGSTFEHVPESENDTPDTHAEDQAFYMLKDAGPILSTSGNCTQWSNFISGFAGFNMLVCMDVSDSDISAIIGGGKIDSRLYDYFLEFYENPTTGNGIEIKDNLPSCSYPLIQTVYNDYGRLFACPNSNGLYYRDDFLVNIADDLTNEIKDSCSIQIYPNPATEKVMIVGPVKKDLINVKVFNSIGQLIFTGRNDESYIDVSGFKSGLYIIELNAGNKLIRKKVIIN